MKDRPEINDDMAGSDMLQWLQTGDIEVAGLLPWSSNYAFLIRVYRSDGRWLTAVYKPQAGEQPLWDFSAGTLCQREMAAYLVSDALGWDLVPPTVLRPGPHGTGSVQLFIEHNPERHYFTFEGDIVFRRCLQQIALFDTIINNADRKGGHVLLQKTGGPSIAERLWAIDHGLCFHAEYKLRTVIWQFAGMPIPLELLADLAAFRKRLDAQNHSRLQGLLSSPEILALKRRLDRIIKKQIFIEHGPGRYYPWPPV